MLKIATHDSATGEKPANILSRLVSLFSKTQNKSIQEQLTAGARFFDIRIRKSWINKDKWVLAHGLWTAKKSPEEVFLEISKVPGCFVRVIYEGSLSTLDKIDEFLEYVDLIHNKYSNITITNIHVKNPDLKVLYSGYQVPFVDYYAQLYISKDNWKWIIPIPALWNKKYENPQFDENKFLMVDFL